MRVLTYNNTPVSGRLVRELHRHFPTCTVGVMIGNSGHCTCGHGCSFMGCSNSSYWIEVPDLASAEFCAEVEDWLRVAAYHRNVKGVITMCLARRC
jgi:hypothetical protein